MAQAERLWIAAEIHGLKNIRFQVFARQIGVDRPSAYEVLKLHPHRKECWAQCRKDKHWPGWRVCADWFKPDAGSNDTGSEIDDTGYDIELDAPITRNKGLLTPTWQRHKVSDDEYGTPQALFNYYDNIYPLTVDVCSTRKLAKCKKFYTPKQDGLSKEWVGVCWMNPPYSSLGAWVKKAHEAAKNGAVVVALLPMFTDTAWFHGYASHATIEALKGRLQFENRPDNGYSSFGHTIFVFRQKSARAGDQLAISVAGHRIGTRLGK